MCDAILTDIVHVIIITGGYATVLSIVAPGSVLTITIGLSLEPVFTILHVSIRSEYVAIGGLGVGSEVHTDIDDRLTLLTLLGSNDDDTTGSLSTVDGS